ncbi:MAG: cation:dicarboxylase symporter family transporter [Sphingomonadales bacterium]|nr:cation:dicarboxylase symporter family transporter [Sphingomonadales bacterium]MDE2171077.1 cation:dicarboxylase symporter family transporter [Sphingomonadales bacterium]
MTRTQTILLSLVLGVVAGLSLRALGHPGLLWLAGAIQPVGQMWVRALQMTLIPLIFAMVAQGAAQAVQGGRGGRLIGTALGVFFALLSLTALLSTITSETVLHLWPLPPHALAGLAPDNAQAPPGVAQQLLAIIPDNPVAAAAQGQIFPLVIFALAFGLAIARLKSADGSPSTLPATLAQIAQAMMVIVDWVLVAAPLGIFVLALGLATQSGLEVAHMLAVFVALCLGNSVMMALVCYLLVLACRAAPIAAFARAIAPAQAMAAGTSSSMATTPVMIEAALDRLKLPEDVAGLVIPMAVSLFRMGTVANAVPAVLVAAHAAGIEPSLLQLVVAGVAAVLASMTAGGLPGAAVIYAFYAPGLQVLGAPLAIMPLYIAVIAIPDPIITAASVTGDLTAATLVARLMKRGR